jgi:hypothetical protein
MRVGWMLLLMLVAAPLWAQDLRVLTWQEMIPPDAPPVKLITAPIHNLSSMADTLSVESAPAAHQLAPHAPVVKSLDGQQVRLPGYIVPLEVSEEGRVTEFLRVHSRPTPAAEPDRSCDQRIGGQGGRALPAVLDRRPDASQGVRQRTG